MNQLLAVQPGASSLLGTQPLDVPFISCLVSNLGRIHLALKRVTAGAAWRSGERRAEVKAAIYARVSTVDQKCEMQLRELSEYCCRRGWQVAGEYVDTGWSGTKASRPELDRLMRHAGEHQFDCVIVWKLDRFGRSVLNLVESLNRLASAGVRFIATTQSIDTDESNPTSKLLLYILAAVAEFEREMIRERVVAGLASAKHRGQQLGRRRLLFDRERALSLHRAGKSIREISGALQVNRGTIHRFLVAQKPAPGTKPPAPVRRPKAA